MSVLLPVEIGVLAIHVVVVGWELAGRKQRKEAQRREEARKQAIERRLRDLAGSCPECIAVRGRRHGAELVADGCLSGSGLVEGEWQ